MKGKKKDPLLELLGYESESELLVTADEELMRMIKGMIAGDLVSVLEASQIKRFTLADLEKASGIVKGHTSGYVKKFFAKTEIYVTDVEENADETIAVVHLKGETVSLKELAVKSIALIEQNESTLHLHSGKASMRKFGKAMHYVEKTIHSLKSEPVEGIVHMEKVNGNWKIVDREELSHITVRSSIGEIEKLVYEHFGRYL